MLASDNRACHGIPGRRANLLDQGGQHQAVEEGDALASGVFGEDTRGQAPPNAIQCGHWRARGHFIETATNHRHEKRWQESFLGAKPRLINTNGDGKILRSINKMIGQLF
ncbi:hypothetical protein [Ralstonia pseudosolanacearum]|uniref:hypothetical protein n=1 Tax=Ralstonia pseudosolanacearum TaxID=1310165 RepID=UPI00115FA296|nr:hypothetical protein [Ralstonia pseudosolanacearum]MCL1617844.1 hypothetical protein [Ralstonia pseudosolanacearum CaRs-Mep]